MRIRRKFAQRPGAARAHTWILGSAASTHRSVSALSFSPWRATNSKRSKRTDGSSADDNWRRKMRLSTTEKSALDKRDLRFSKNRYKPDRAGGTSSRSTASLYIDRACRK